MHDELFGQIVSDLQRKPVASNPGAPPASIAMRSLIASAGHFPRSHANDPPLPPRPPVVTPPAPSVPVVPALLDPPAPTLPPRPPVAAPPIPPIPAVTAP